MAIFIVLRHLQCRLLAISMEIRYHNSVKIVSTAKWMWIQTPNRKQKPRRIISIVVQIGIVPCQTAPLVQRFRQLPIHRRNIIQNRRKKKKKATNYKWAMTNLCPDTIDWEKVSVDFSLSSFGRFTQPVSISHDYSPDLQLSTESARRFIHCTIAFM